MKWNNIWYSKHWFALTLAPLSWLFCAIVQVRRYAYQYGLLANHRVSVPVIIVGNITVGGTGKTPLVIWLGQFLKQQGYKPGIVSRGYGGYAQKWPQSVYPDSDPYLVGDEPVLLARHSGCPVTVAPQRIVAVQNLLENTNCNLIISDDGLQHYALARDIEIAVIDGIRRYGNQRCLPAGPLREPLHRLQEIDFLVTKIKSTPNFQETGLIATMPDEFFMQPLNQSLRRVTNDSVVLALSTLRDQTVHAIAGIGHPAPFFTDLRNHGLKVHCHEFPDHHYYRQTDIEFDDDLPVIMTEKDAVKCRTFASSRHWYLPIEANLSDSFGNRLLELLKKLDYPSS